jgi:hypothetical protein
MLWCRNWSQQTVIAFNLFEAYISSVESPCTVDSTLSDLRLLPWLDIGIVSTLLHFLSIVLWVASTPRVLYLSGYHTLFDSFRVLPHIPTYNIQCGSATCLARHFPILSPLDITTQYSSRIGDTASQPRHVAFYTQATLSETWTAVLNSWQEYNVMCFWTSGLDSRIHIFTFYASRILFFSLCTANATSWTRTRASRATPGIDSKVVWSPIYSTKWGSEYLSICLCVVPGLLGKVQF